MKTNPPSDIQHPKSPRGTLLLAAALALIACAAARADELDSMKQRFVARKYGMFLHYNMSTYTGMEWAFSYSTEDAAKLFVPTGLIDTDQWADLARKAGMKYAVLTAKHTDGFCLWDTAVSDYDIASCSWFNDPKNVNYKRDIVKAYTDSFRKAGLGVGLYYSIWDKRNGIGPRNYKKDVLGEQLSSAAATEYIKTQLKELLTDYGPIEVLWFDGWGMNLEKRNGIKWDGYKAEGDVGGRFAAIEYAAIRDFVRAISPGTLIVNNSGKGNPELTDILPYETTLPEGTDRRPCEACDCLRADMKWFWHPDKDEAMRPAKVIVERMRHVNACNGAYLLDVPPARDGKIQAAELKTLMEIKDHIDGLK
jgi:alpha-L-fucosidase